MVPTLFELCPCNSDVGMLFSFFFHFLNTLGEDRRMPRRRPYRVECTGSLLTSEVKRHRARSVLGWGTAWEDLRVLSAFTRRRACCEVAAIDARPRALRRRIEQMRQRSQSLRRCSQPLCKAAVLRGNRELIVATLQEFSRVATCRGGVKTLVTFGLGVGV